jgi:uncharacterized membrane protein
MTTATGLYDWLLLAHVLGAMLWMGGLVAVSAFAVLALRGREPEAVGRLVGSLRVVGPAVLAPGPLLLLAFGIWMVADSEAWEFGQTWIALALGLLVAVIVVGAAHQSRTAIAAERAATRGDHGEAVRQLRRWAWGSALMVALLVVATWDMVFKPGL